MAVALSIEWSTLISALGAYAAGTWALFKYIMSAIEKREAKVNADITAVSTKLDQRDKDNIKRAEFESHIKQMNHQIESLQDQVQDLSKGVNSRLDQLLILFTSRKSDN